MEEWARRKNIENFERDLQAETDPARRRVLEEFITSERARLAEIKRARKAGKA